jgi:hypothetical protein
MQDDIFEHGIYYVKQDDDTVFFVTPEIKKSKYSEDVFISGDHFSFPFMPKRREIHLHMTTYTPLPTDINVGQITHNPRNVFDDGIMMPTKGYETHIFDNMGGSKNYVLDLCRAHVLRQQNGGGGRSRKNQGNTTGISLELERLLISFKVEKVVAFGYKNGNSWNIMVDLVASKKKVDDIAFTLKKPTFRTFQNHLIKSFKNRLM